MSAGRLLALGATALVLVLVRGSFFGPPEIPLHFGLDGSADRMGSRGRWAAELGLAGAAVTAVFVGLLRWLPRLPVTALNLPHKEYWARPENEDRVRRMVAEDLGRIGAVTLLMLAAVGVLTIEAAEQPGPSLGRDALVVVGGYVALVLLWSLLAVRRRYRVPPGERGVGG